MHQLRIVLKDVEPKVIREVLVPSDIRLDRLHQVIQIAMGWTDLHLHEFVIGTLRDGMRYGPKGPETAFFGDGPDDERKATLQQIARSKGSKFRYVYDFGDDWLHEISVKSVDPSDSGFALPHCLGGTGACPPEDCGGPYGYAELLETLRDPKHEDHAEMLEWIGGPWDPQRYDNEDVNAALVSLAGSWKRAAKKPTKRKA